MAKVTELKFIQISYERVCYLPLVKGLVGGNGHHDFITDTEEEKTSLGQVKSNLTDDLIKALGEELLTDGANATLSSLTFHKLLVEHFSESGHIDSGGGLVANVLDEVLTFNASGNSNYSFGYRISEMTYLAQPTLWVGEWRSGCPPAWVCSP